VTARALAEVADLVARTSGIVITAAQAPSLAAAIARTAPGMTAERLVSEGCPAGVLERLIDEITVRETFFFRHRTELDTIDWHGALQAARARGSHAVCVWVAGCASGEEAYTIAILACEAFGTSAPPVRILATDIAATALVQARGGSYGARAVRTIDEAVRLRYFRVEDQRLIVGPSLRALVEVRRHNLVRDAIPPAGSMRFDVIFCRNVLIYFDRSTVDRVVASLEGALWPGGRLVLGAADRLSGHPRTTSAVPKPRARRPASTRPSVAPAPPATAAVPWAGGSLAARDEARPERLAQAMRAADRGDLEVALRIAGDALVANPLDAEAYFIIGVAELAREQPRAAVGSLRRALYIDPTSGLTAFKLARAHDSLGELGPARRAYEQALRTLELDVRKRPVAETRDLAEVTTACRARLQALVHSH
jgi:chemotaxis protein methyltransferase CheR